MPDPAETSEGCEWPEGCGADPVHLVSWGGNIRPRKERLCDRHADDRRTGLLRRGEQVTFRRLQFDGFNAWQAAQGEAATENVDGDETPTENQ
jgi:hypothetical protein